MRYTAFDLQCTDIMWFGVDIYGNIFQTTTAACGNVPEYVCRSREETDFLEAFFLDTAPVITHSNLLIKDEDNTLVHDAKLLSSKGIFCYDVTDFRHKDVYNCISFPDKALKITELPEDIQQILSDHLYNGNVEEERKISVSHAY